MAIDIYTDGSCKGTPGRGGWSFIALRGQEELACKGGAEPVTTNNAMELRACIEALAWYSDAKMPPEEAVVIRSDSKYVINGITLWIKKWEQNGWYSSTGDPVKNRALWEKLSYYVKLSNKISWEWVKGHNGDKYNELVDMLAKSMTN